MTDPRRARRFGSLLFAAAALLVGGRLPAQSARQIGGAGIAVFQHENFRGKNASFRSDVPDLRRHGFDDRISSLHVGPGEYWEVCEHPSYRGRCQIFSRDEPDLRRVGWQDRISSIRRVRNRPPVDPPSQGGRRGIILYADPFFRGEEKRLRDSVKDMRLVGFDDRAESVRIRSGRWELCEHPNYRECRIVDRDQEDLADLGLRRRISSVRRYSRDQGEYLPPRPGRSPLLMVYDETGYRGRSHTIESPVNDLSSFWDGGGSVRVIRGAWQMCAGRNWSGRCTTISGDVPDLRAHGLGSRMMSARPLDDEDFHP